MTERADLLDLHLAALFTQDEHGNLVATNDPEPDQVAAPRLYLGRTPERCVLRFRRGLDESTRAALRELAAPDLTPNDPNREPVNQAAMVDLLAAEQPIQSIYFGPAFSFPDSGTEARSLRHSGEELAPNSIRGGNLAAAESVHPYVGATHASPLQRSTSVTESAEPNSGILRHSGGGRNPNPEGPEVIEVTPSTTHLLSPEFAWLADELTVRDPVMAVVVNGMAVSVCFSARATSAASEAGVETLPEHRGRRYAGAVTAAWAAELQRQGRIPLYSTSWTNHASRRVAARLGLIQYATDFHIT